MANESLQDFLLCVPSHHGLPLPTGLLNLPSMLKDRYSRLQPYKDTEKTKKEKNTVNRVKFGNVGTCTQDQSLYFNTV